MGQPRSPTHVEELKWDPNEGIVMVAGYHMLTEQCACGTAGNWQRAELGLLARLVASSMVLLLFGGMSSISTQLPRQSLVWGHSNDFSMLG